MRPIILSIFFVSGLWAQTGNVSNAADVIVATLSGILSPFPASQFQVGVPGSPSLAPGSLATITYNFAGPVFIYSPISAPISATVSLRSAGSALSIPAQVTASTPGSITFVVPPSVSPGAVQVIYRQQGGVTNWTTATITPASFSLFRSGTPGPVRAQQVGTDGSLATNGLATPAKTGQPVVLWGSGLGGTPASKIGVALGGIPQALLFAGPSPSLPGVDQINFRIAPGTPDGCYLPLTVTYGQQTATSFLSTTADGSPCAHPLQLTTAELRTLDAGGTISSGEVDTSSALVVTAAGHAYRQETATVQSAFYSAQQLAGYFSASANPTPSCFLPVPLQQSFFATAVFFSGLIDPPPNLGDKIVLSNGITSLVLTPPVGSPPFSTYATPIPIGADSTLAALPPPLLSVGQWTWTPSGGDLPPGPFSFNLPQPIQINAAVPLTIIRSQDQTLTWDGTGLDPGATITVSLSGPALSQYSSSPLLVCQGPAKKGSITIPKELLSQIAQTTATLTANVNQLPGLILNPTLKSGTSLLLVTRPSSSDSRPVEIQ